MFVCLFLCCIVDLQIWDRRKHIASGTDPLNHIFTEFDEDHDGYLDAEDVCSALRSRHVEITHEQAQMFLEGTCSIKHGCVCICDLLLHHQYR